MKKFLVVLVVLAMTTFTSAAFAADIAVSGGIDIRSRDFNNTNAQPSNTDSATSGDQRDTQERVRLTIDAKTDGAKARISLENDWDEFGAGVRVENPMANGASTGNAGFVDIREAWINFNLPGIPVNINVGHQLLQLGHGYFFRSMKYGSDAWVVANVTGPNTVAVVDVKALEGNTYSADDIDAYVLLDVVKLSDALTAGIDLTQVNDRRATLSTPALLSFGAGLEPGTANPFKDIKLNNIGVNVTATAGPLNLKAEIDYQTGKAASSGAAVTPAGAPVGSGGIVPDVKFKGNQVVVLGDLAAGPAKVNFTVARGSGSSENDTDVKQYVTIMDADPHYTFLYEYKVKTGAINVLRTDGLHTGFANTTALNLGASMDVAKSLNIGAQLWYLKATEKVAINGGAVDVLGNPTSDELGNEIDVKVAWKLYDNLTWTWDLGYFMPGKAYDSPGLVAGTSQSADNVTGIQGVLAYKF
jgi:hypothetical protein